MVFQKPEKITLPAEGNSIEINTHPSQSEVEHQD